MKTNNYAVLNSNNICIDVMTTVKDYGDTKGYIDTVDFNPTLLYKKWLGEKGWSQETYEPEIDSVIQERLDDLELENQKLSGQVIDLNSSLGTLNTTNEMLVLSIAELTAMLATIQTP